MYAFEQVSDRKQESDHYGQLLSCTAGLTILYDGNGILLLRVVLTAMFGYVSAEAVAVLTYGEAWLPGPGIGDECAYMNHNTHLTL